MSRTTKWVFVPMIALSVTMLLAHFSRADDSHAKQGTATITGKVVDQDGKPVANAPVQLLSPQKRAAAAEGEGAEHAAKHLAADDNNGGQSGDKPHAGHKGRSMAAAVASTNTDADGKFTFANVEAGDYVVFANVRGQGRAREKVSVASGDNKEVELKLAPPKARAK